MVENAKCSKFFLIPQRVVTVIFLVTGMGCAFGIRLCLPLVLTKIVKQENKTFACPEDPSILNEFVGMYDWTEQDRGFILSSFYVGYMISHLPGGWLSDKVSGRWVMGIGILLSAIGTLFTPIIIILAEVPGLIVLSLLIGLAEGLTLPAANALLAHWIPAKKKSLYAAITLGGIHVGNIVTHSLAGFFLHNYDWNIMFFFFGCLAIIWYIPFSVLVYSNPSLHPFIKQKEIEYLNATTTRRIEGSEHLPVPWKSIFKSVPVWALIAQQIGHDFSFFIVIMNLQTYLSTILQLSISSIGFYLASMYTGVAIILVISALIAELLIERSICTVTTVRKALAGTDSLSALFMLFAVYTGCSKKYAIILFGIGISMMGTYYAGVRVNPLDLSPNHAGILMALVNGIGAITAVFSPNFISILTPNGELKEWFQVFWFLLAARGGTLVIYLVFGSGNVQPFNDEGRENLQPETSE